MSAEPETPANYRKMLRQRTRAAREARGWTQAEIAGYLGLDFEAYKKYETRTPLPHHLVGPFCTLTHINVEFYMTGKQPEKRAARRAARVVRKAG